MRLLKRLLASSVVFVAILTGATATPAAASPAVELRATCYGGAVSFPNANQAPGAYRYLPSSSGYYTASSRCTDINIRFGPIGDGGSTSGRVCWVSAGGCNAWRTVYISGTWQVMATNVLDGTRFRIQLSGDDWTMTYGGQVAF